MKKIIALFFSLCLVLSLCSCGQNANVGTQVNEPVTETTEVETTTKPAVKEKLVMVTNAEFPPYEFKEGNKFLGIDVDIANEIANDLGVELEILDIAFDSIIPSITSGKADLGLAGMSVTEDRKMNVDFSNTYTTAIQNIIVTDDSEISNSEYLADKKIGVQLGTTGDMYCTDDFGEENIERYPKIVDAVQGLKTGKLDAVVVDDKVAENLVNSTTGLKILETPYALEEYAIAIKKGNTELLNKVNNVIDKLQTSGKLDQIKSKYINSNEKTVEKLIMATNAEFPPYEFKEGNEFFGVDVDIANAIAKKLGKELEILDIAFDSIIPAVSSGKADIGIAAMSVTEDRKQFIDFTNTYTTAVQNIIVNDNSSIESKDDLNGKIIGVQLGTTGDMYCTDDFGDQNIQRFNKIVDAVQALKTNKLDAVVVDDKVAENLVETNEGLAILSTPYTLEEYAMAVAKGNSELLDKVNAVIDELQNSGELDNIKAKYIK